ncbi:hypothetical protein BC830DRAFT_1100647 [Chytriomyces sp. MP71]|nr:hypothetical protein BC830DRAFT_1100647 [Chytriomyces sp. MP71]
MQRQVSSSPRTGKRGDRQTASKVSSKGFLSVHQDALNTQHSKTVRQRITEAKRSNFLDLQGLNLSLLPEEVWDMENLRALLLGNNNFTAVPANIPATFPNLQYLDLSRNNISSIPSNLSEMTELLVLDFSENPALDGYTLPASYGPIRHAVAIFVDNESIEFVDEEKAGRRRGKKEKDGEDAEHEDKHDVEEEDDETYQNTDSHDESQAEDDEEDEGDDDEAGLHAPSVHKRRDLMEDVALKLRRFMKMVKDLEDATDLQSNFQRLLAAKDPMFIKFLSKRFHVTAGSVDGESSDDGADAIARRREIREDVSFERKEKEKWVKGSRDVGRKMKTSNRMLD